MTKSYSFEHGFTLMELVVVLAIILVITAIALPQVVTILAMTSMNSAVNAATGAIAAARSQSMSEGEPFKIVFSAASLSYSVSRCATCTSATLPADEIYTAVANKTSIPLAPNANLALSADQTLYLRPGGAVQTTVGTTNCSAWPTLTLTNTQVQRTKTITIGCYGQITVS